MQDLWDGAHHKILVGVFFPHHTAALRAGPWGSVTTQSEELLRGEKGLLNFAFLHSCFIITLQMPPVVAASFPLLPGIFSQAACLGHFPAPLLTVAHLPGTLRAQTWETGLCRAQRTVRTPPACQTLLGDRDGWVNGAVGEILSSNQAVWPLHCPASTPTPWGRGKMQRMVDWQGLIPNIAVWPKPCPAIRPALEWALRCVGAAACLFLHQACPST